MLQPLAFHVVTRAPSKRLRNRSTGLPDELASHNANHEGRRSPCCNPCNQDRADIAVFSSAAAHDPEHLSSYPEPRGAWSADRCSHPEYPREIRSIAHPFARRDSATARQRCLGSARARLAVHAGLSAPRNQRARDASGRRLQSTCQRRAPDEPRGVRICSRKLDSLRRTVPARGDRPLRPGFRRPKPECYSR
jgi:hypothetical protein